MPTPHLTFFTELEAAPLQELFTKKLIADLAEMDASVAIGLLDMGEERTSVVKRLNKAGVPVIAWLLLPREQGYWFNISNTAQAAARYAEFQIWTAEQGLLWDGVGLDIEPDINEMAMFFTNRWKLLPRVLRRVFDRRLVASARQAYSYLVAQIQADGYRVDSYQFPFITDERRAGSTLLQRAAGLVDLPADREVWMLYSSFYRPHGPGVIACYAPEAQSIGLGSTGGGVVIDSAASIEAVLDSEGQHKASYVEPPPLTWDELARDLRLSWYWCNDLHIFSLEGCVRQGFLAQLKDFQWDYPIIIPEEGLTKVRHWRHTLRSSLWLSSHLLAILVGVAAVALLLIGLRRQFKRK